MEQIRNIIYYHIAKGNNLYSHLWRVGNELEFSPGTTNYYYKSLIDCLNGLQKDCNEKLAILKALSDDEKLERNFSRDLAPINIEDHYLFSNISDCLLSVSKKAIFFNDKYTQVLKETILEKERITNYPLYPSRKSALWVCAKDDLAEWDESFCGSARDVYKVELTGTIFHTDGGLIDSVNFIAPMTFDNLAQKYWAATENFQREECLFEGKVKILAKYESVNELLNSDK
ncbi:hypothetical protein CJD36_007495 [Flavipsychrobacter stenotrophus]|uniref:DUF2441 domain-containing protein n=1 Tax=Flavipsychrobacter stenotrophus TaxID=2077091 RepID=A0A2S7SYD1_9BACT|nr:DUF2441 domain-containing protein [Flavipsychrobacter stenotrophus]PQJ11631.1 hypothetical protein CJD36_007495 [Flavipsychrobacter stenotrophus]